MNKIYFGKTTMTHGLKGELKLYTDFSLKEKVLKPGFKIYIDEEEHEITKVAQYKNFYLITIDNLKHINLVEHLRNKNIYINYDDLNLDNNEYIVEELINYQVYDNNILIGEVIDYSVNSNITYLKVKGKKEFLIPLVKEWVKEIIKSDRKIITNKGSDLII